MAFYRKYTEAMLQRYVRMSMEAGKVPSLLGQEMFHGNVTSYLDSMERYSRVYEQAGVAGWLTTAGSKPAMISRLGALLVESPSLFLSKRLLQECRTFIAFAGGKTGAASGAHDDCVMAMALAHAVRAERLQTGGNRTRAV